ncbi:MAG TPA: maltotransferase domain-containing protein [Alphaproteobacteria bacterium]|nr:maltotransferase domain-containing protein [Alphaproteobacteria bacterium]
MTNGSSRAPSPEAGPRIYNLFPLLVGPIEAWSAQLPRVDRMGFDWIYLNPFHYPGFSGSLYAIKDPYRLHDLFAAGGDGEAALTRFVADAERREIRVMMDLVVNHTAKDAVLVGAHPEWYRRDATGELYSPRAIDPGDTTKVTVWGDLAELDYERAGARAGLIDYWLAYLRHYIGLGFRGFRCDAAYKVPAEVWAALIAGARREAPDVVFFAETLGCGTSEVQELREAGFDYLFNSSKWWDFRADWLLDQYDAFRRIAPSISFPESHDTERLAAEGATDDPDRIAQLAKFRYLFAACFSTGVMMPIGYEYGFRKRLDVVRTRPEDWEEPAIDISDFIAAANGMKRAFPALSQEGPQRRISAPQGRIVALLRRTEDRRGDCALILLNPDREHAHSANPGALIAETGGSYAGFRDVTPQTSPLALVPGSPITLDPLELRVFRGEHRDGRATAARRDGKQSLRRLERLAQQRLTIEEVWPEIDGGRHPVKRVVGDVLEVWADIFCDGHEQIAARILYREAAAPAWREAPLAHFDNDRWVGRVPLARNARYLYTIEAWRDLFATWRIDVTKKRDAGQTIALELVEGRRLVEAAREAAAGRDADSIDALLKRLDSHQGRPDEEADILLSDELRALMHRIGQKVNLTRYGKELEVVVDRTAARYGAWYELFPRSASGDPTRHGTFDDVVALLPYIRGMGFDVLYFPPIHPIGRTNRKGRNNSLKAEPGDPGSPYAIGAREGGHTAIHPELGTFEDFARLLEAVRDQGMELALDFAIQCSPDHPWIKEHPEWFDWRPDGTIRYAENPPKKYEDIVNLHFYRGALPSVWLALRDVVLFWAERGVRIFRVDNPHTKPVPFWEWMIREVQDRYPDVIFLSEAFTRPKMMRKLAKAGFTQSYTYFTWRHTKTELETYMTELAQTTPREYLRPNLFVNTPDINPPFLQTGGRAAFLIRAALAATLSSLWGVYSGFELCEATPIPGREEYLNSEKYEIKAWDWDRPGNIRGFIARLNRIRRDNPAFHDYKNLRFYPASDPNILFYGKADASRENVIWIAVNVDPHHAHEADIALPLAELGVDERAEIGVEELIAGARFDWRGRTQRIRLDPQGSPAAIWRVRAPGPAA